MFRGGETISDEILNTKKLKFSSYSSIIIFISYTSFFSLYTSWWSLILLPTVISLIGVLKRDKGFLTFGIVLVELHFLFLHITDPLNFLYLFIISGSFFLAYLTISLSNNVINILNIYDQKSKTLENPYIKQFKSSSLKYIVFTSLSAFFVSIMGSFFSIYGYMSISNNSMMMVVSSFVFTLIILMMIYLLIIHIPKKKSGFSMEE